MTIVHSVFIHS